MTVARPASTVMVLRDTPAGFEVLMGRRPTGQAFGGAWVFPGGAVDPEDHDPLLTGLDGVDDEWRAAALREVAEEVGIFITDPPTSSDVPLAGRQVYEHVLDAGAAWDVDRLAYLSNWVTPEGLRKRFDTRFYLLVIDRGTEAGVVSEELEAVAWVTPALALERYEAGEIELIMPTIAHLRMLLPFDSARTAEAYARGQRTVERVAPRIIMRDGRPHLELE